MPDPSFPIQPEPTARYLFWSQIARLVFPFALFFGAGIALALIYAFTIGRTLPRRQAAALALRLEGDIIRIDAGVYFLTRKSIPLDRVTDVALEQGPILRRFGLWSIKIQTAGTDSSVGEATIPGLEHPERVRDELIAARDAAVKRGHGTRDRSIVDR